VLLLGNDVEAASVVLEPGGDFIETWLVPALERAPKTGRFLWPEHAHVEGAIAVQVLEGAESVTTSGRLRPAGHRRRPCLKGRLQAEPWFEFAQESAPARRLAGAMLRAAAAQEPCLNRFLRRMRAALGVDGYGRAIRYVNTEICLSTVPILS